MHSTDLISIIDLGTGSIRNTIYDTAGTIVDGFRMDNPIIFPKPGWAEQDPVWWWDIIKQSFHQFDDSIREQITAISVTSQREGIVPVDKQFEPLDKIIIWLDGRTDSEAAFIEKTLGRKKIYDICGLIPHPVWSLSKILWLKHHRHEIYNSAYKFLQAEDYVVSRLAQIAVTEYSIASRTCLLDVHKKKWSQEILDAFQVDGSKLPELMEPGSFVGNIDEPIAREFKLSTEVSIYTGAGDQQAAAIGSGAVFEGSVSIGIGTSSALSVTLSQPTPDPSQNIILNCAAIPGMWEYEPPIWNTGGLVKWYFEQFEDNCNDYSQMLDSLSGIPAGSDGLIALPYFSGSGSPRWNPLQKGVFYGLTPAHTRLHLLNALMEGVAFEIKYNLEVIRHSGVAIQNLILSGGASQNIPLCNIISDVLQMDVEISRETEASSIGVFILIKSALEKEKNLRSIFKALQSHNEVIYPRSENAQLYEQIYDQYIRLGDLFDKHKI